MSRTTKDKPTKFRADVNAYVGWSGWWMDEAFRKENVHTKFLTVPKLRKEVDFESHWMSTPSEWTKLMMNRPMRHKLKNKLAEFKGTKVNFQLLEDFDEEEGYSKRPHVYYW